MTAEPGKQGIIIEREFETFEARNGGSWRYIQKDANGNEFAFHGIGCNTGGVYG